MLVLPQRWPAMIYAFLLLFAGGLTPGVGGALTAVAQEVPRVLSYQGQIVKDGGPVRGTVELTFRLHPAPTGEATVGTWAQTELLDLEAGVASVLLGDTSQDAPPLPPELVEAPELYLGVSLDGEEIDRVRLTSTPFALRAERAAVAEGVAEGSIDASALEDGIVVRRIRARGHDLSDDVQLSGDGIRLIVEEDAGEIVFSIQNGAVTQSKLAPNAAVRSLTDVNGNQLAGNLILQSSNNSIEIVADTGSGSIDFSTTNVFPSSVRYKEQIETIDDADALMTRLRGVRYLWREDGEPDIGLIADEVAEVLPELVAFNADGSPEGVRLAPLVAVLIEHGKAQQRTIDELSDRVDVLEHLVRQAIDRRAPPARQE